MGLSDLVPDFLEPYLPYAGAVGGYLTGGPMGAMAGYGLTSAALQDPSKPYQQQAGAGRQAAGELRGLGAETMGMYQGAIPGAIGYTDPSTQFIRGRAAAPGPSTLSDAYSEYKGMGAPEYVRQFGGRQAAGLEQPGMYEQFVQSTVAGYNPALERLREQGMRQMNQQLAARGMGASTTAGEALAEYNAALDAAEFARRAEMVKGAQETQLARLLQAQGLAGEQSEEALAGRGQLLQAAEASQQLEQERERALMAAMAQADAMRADIFMRLTQLGIGSYGDATQQAIAAEYGAGVAGAQGTMAAQAYPLDLMRTGMEAYNFVKQKQT
jgi:hypothetical protein